MCATRPADHTAPPPAETPSYGRDARGRFAKGNSGGPGNPFARRVAELRKVILDRIQEEDLLAITEALLARAKEGNVGAAKLILAYTLGKPAPAPDPDRLDEQELQSFKDKIETVSEVHELSKEVEVAVDPRPKGSGMSTDYALLMTELVRNPKQYDNPVCVEAVTNALHESDTSEGVRPTWQPPSAYGLFGELPPRIRQLAQELFAAEVPSLESSELVSGSDWQRLAPRPPSTNGHWRSPEEGSEGLQRV